MIGQTPFRDYPKPPSPWKQLPYQHSLHLDPAHNPLSPPKPNQTTLARLVEDVCSAQQLCIGRGIPRHASLSLPRLRNIEKSVNRLRRRPAFDHPYVTEPIGDRQGKSLMTEVEEALDIGRRRWEVQNPAHCVDDDVGVVLGEYSK